jgi:4-hydroxy-tetrahydrodipicolinate synthase
MTDTANVPPPPLAGIWLPLVTPFRDGVLDEASLVRLAGHYAASAIDGIILAGTTGEALTLDDDETARLVDIVADIVESRLPVYLGLCGSDTRKLAKRLAATAAWPIGGYLVACPYYTRPSQDGLRRHFLALAEATERPLVLYNIPYRTGVNLANETLLRLAERPNIVGVKDCCADQVQSFDLMRARPDGFAVMTGEDALLYAALTQGGDGAILASAHVETARFAAIRQMLLAGDHRAALQAWRGLVEVARLLFAEPSPAPIKHWLARARLIDSPEVRAPMMPISASLAARIEREMDVRVAQAA